MNYKVGDKVLLYSWDEMVDKFGIDCTGYIKVPNGFVWDNDMDNYFIPKNRVLTITKNDTHCKCVGNTDVNIIKELIKCHANEFYLQQIKEEL